MKKRRKAKHHQDNIFLFPNVDKLLLEKGLDRLKNKKFNEAIEFLEEAQQLDEDNEDIAFGLIVAYFEVNNLTAAKELAQSTLKKGAVDYFQLIDIYITILLQLNEYEEIVATIGALLEEKEIPIEKLDSFTKILEFSKRKLDTVHSASEQVEDESIEEWNLLEYESLNEQFLAVAELAHKNVRAYLPHIRIYLQSPDGHPFVKTMLLQLLKEQEVSQEVEVEKFDKYIKMKPVELPNMEQYLADSPGLEHLKNELEQDNPTLFESINAIFARHSFLLYPLSREPITPSVWAAAYHYIGLEFYGEQVSIEKLAKKYLINQGEISETLRFLKKLEEISSPIL
ncbi:tetratricopeptide repeat protein [Pseudoneobacillus sp. C159]